MSGLDKSPNLKDQAGVNMHTRNRGGFTLIELIIVIAIIAIIASVVLIIPVIICGNFYFSEDGVLRELKVDHPQVTEVLKVERNVVSDSVITVKEGGENKAYSLDSDIFFNYEFKPSE